ncbi:two-component system, sensor histidine kinase and response regulator [Gammaproteobacteria bacterium]
MSLHVGDIAKIFRSLWFLISLLISINASAGKTFSLGEEESVSLDLGVRARFTNMEKATPNGRSRSSDFSFGTDPLTSDERNWLINNQSRLVLAVETGYPPFVFIDSTGQPTGLAQDYLNLVESKLGVRFNQKRFSSLGDIFEKVRSGEVQIVNAVTQTPERSRFLSMTDPFVSVPNVIIVKKERSDKLNEGMLPGLKVSLVRNYAITENLISKQLGIMPDLVSDDLSALLNVSFGRSDAAIIDLGTASYLIEKNSIANLRVAGEVAFKIQLSMATPIAETVLYGILKKGLATITEEERRQIHSRWINASSESLLTKQQLLTVVGGVLALVLLVFLWNWSLRQQVALRTAALIKEQEALKESEAQKRTLISQHNLELENQINLRTRELRSAMNRLEMATNAAGIGIWVWNYHDNTLVWDQRMFEIYGAPPAARESQLLYEFWRSRVHPDDITMAEQKLHAQMEGSGRYDPVFRIVMPDGGIRYIQAAAFIDRDHAGKSIRMVGINRDITEQCEAENVLRQERAKADAANMAKSQFLANMSHEIRTPMNAVLGMLQLMRHTHLDALQQDYADKAHSAAQSLLSILNDILDFSKVEAGKLELERAPFLAQEILHNLSVILGTAAKDKDIEVLFDLDSALPAILIGDALRLQQVLLNLASNAIKFTARGTVVLGLVIREINNGHARMEFSVRDTGIGIAPDKLATIFEGFTQAEASTTRRFGGTGLGLVISQRLVGLMGGQLQVDSTLDVGSRFYFTIELPYADASTKVGLAQQATQKMLRVLIVDDSDIAGALLARMATDLGWRVATASNGIEAITHLEGQASRNIPYDIVFLDWKMPRLDGWETARRIRAMCADHTPRLILVTAYGHEIPQQPQEPTDNPFDGFLTKPVTPSKLVDAVSTTSAGGMVTPAFDTTLARARLLAGLKLLLVEDNPTNQQVAQELLGLHGAHVEVANDGAKAVQQVLHAHPPFDAVLMDIQMPVMDGYEATRRLRRDYDEKGLPILAMTANALPADREACLAAGMNDHVGKPFDIREVVTKLLQLCGRIEAMPLTNPPPVSVPPLSATFSGFDLEGALGRMSNQTEFYLSLVATFRRDQRNLRDRLQQALHTSNLEEIARELHTLKGMAGAIGATALADFAHSTETRLKGGDGTAIIPGLVEQWDSKMAETLAVLDDIAVWLLPKNTAAPASANTEIAIPSLFSYLDELEPLLKNSDARVFDVFSALKQNYGLTFGARLDVLDAAIDRMDFKAALQESKILRNAVQ